MFKRARPLADPVTVYLDGAAIEAERGEPLAVALLASDRTTLARSAKLHRPRGPSCLRGGCDGCTARIDGAPNRMTCLAGARGGERIETQNFVGSRRADLLRVTDWFFPRGIDHHHLMAGVPMVQDLMVGFARKLAGMGRLPEADRAPQPAEIANADVLVVGGGAAGLAAASRLAAAGRAVLLVDDGPELGGSLLALPERLRAHRERYPLGAARVLSRAAVVGRYGDDALVATEDRAVVVRAAVTVIASGAHDGVVAVPNDDLPGVMSARALCRLAAYGVVPDGPVAVVGDGFWADAVEAALGAGKVIRVAPAELAGVQGTGGVKAIVTKTGDGERTTKVAVVAIAVPGAPAFEIAAQAGAETRFEPSQGYVVVRDERGNARGSLWAAGECAGLAFDPEAMAADGARVAEAILAG
jgi:sarcosine oxidase subunit alpha